VPWHVNFDASRRKFYAVSRSGLPWFLRGKLDGAIAQRTSVGCSNASIQKDRRKTMAGKLIMPADTPAEVLN
jgi:hypothetical protein